MKKSRIVVIVLIILAAAIAVLAFLNRPADLPESGVLSVTAGDAEIKSYTMEEIQKLPYVEIQKEIISSSHENDEGLFRGVPLHTLLENAGADLAGAEQCVVQSEDGFVSAYSMEEVTESDNILLVYAKNGEALGSMDDGGTGPFRIVVTEDPFGNRCAKYVCRLEIK